MRQFKEFIVFVLMIYFFIWFLKLGWKIFLDFFFFLGSVFVGNLYFWVMIFNVLYYLQLSY